MKTKKVETIRTRIITRLRDIPYALAFVGLLTICLPLVFITWIANQEEEATGVRGR